MILLVHDTTTHGMVSTPDNAHGAPRPARRYHHEGHFLAIDGGDPEVVAHDAELILKIAGFRLATPAEQNEYRKLREQPGKLEESEQDQPVKAEPIKESKPARPPRRKG